MIAAVTGPLVGALAFVRTLNKDSKSSESRLTTLETRMESIDGKVDRVDGKVDKIYDHLLSRGE